MYVESNFRAILKAFTWRASGTLATAILVFIFTGSFKLAFAVGGLEVFAKMALYYVHERAWNRLKFGRKEVEPAVFWLTGYSGAGKKDLAHAIEEKLKGRGLKVELLEGDKIRRIFQHTGYNRSEREEHVRRVGYLASELEKHGIVVIVSMTSPYEDSRFFARRVCKRFIEVHVATPIEECEKRDPKGLWKKARAGELTNFVGIDLEYEDPKNPEISLDLSKTPVEEAASNVISLGFKKI